MEQQILNKDKGVVGLKEDKVYFNSGKHINLESTNVNKLIDLNIRKIIEALEVYQKNGSGILKKFLILKFILLSMDQSRSHLIFLFQIGYR